MVMNLKFLKAEQIMLRLLNESENQNVINDHTCNDPNCQFVQIKGLEQTYFSDFISGQMTFNGFHFSKNLPNENPLYQIEESKHAIQNHLWEKIISQNNIKFSDLKKCFFVDHNAMESAEDVEAIQLEYLCIFSRPYNLNGIDGVLLHSYGEQINVSDNIDVTFPPILIQDVDNKLCISTLDFKGDALVIVEDKEKIESARRILSTYFTTVAFNKLSLSQNLASETYDLNKLQALRKIDEKMRENPREFIKSLLSRVKTEVIPDLPASDAIKAELDQYVEEVQETMLNHIESKQNAVSDSSTFSQSVQKAYMDDLFYSNHLYDGKNNDDVDHSSVQILNKHMVYNLFLHSNVLNKAAIQCVVDYDNHIEQSELHENESSFLYLHNYDWKALAVNLNISFANITGDTLFSSDILNLEFTAEDCPRFLHSFVRPYKHDGVKGILFNVASLSYENGFEIDGSEIAFEMDNLYFFGLKDSEYKLWCFNHKLQNSTELTGSGKYSTLSPLIGAQLCAFLIYMNMLEYKSNEGYYSQGEVNFD